MDIKDLAAVTGIIILVWLIVLAIILGFSLLYVPETLVIADEIQRVSNEIVGEYTLIYNYSLFTYVKSHEIKDGRVYYTKQDGKKGSINSIDARLEEGFIPYKDLHDFGYFEYPAEDVVFE